MMLTYKVWTLTIFQKTEIFQLYIRERIASKKLLLFLKFHAFQLAKKVIFTMNTYFNFFLKSKFNIV